ncbi:IS110 family transposase, partial [Hungatella hathewayi]|nr:IS110 family transposase [Hungatella hathewayi]
NAFVDHYQKWCKRKKYNFSRDKAEEIHGAARELVPVLPKDDLTKLIVKQAIAQLNTASKTVEELRTLMNETAAKLPEYPVVMGMKGVGPSLGPHKTKPQDDPVYAFIDKKRAQGKPYYVYMTAGANKFLRIYYGRVKEYLMSLPE